MNMAMTELQRGKINVVGRTANGRLTHTGALLGGSFDWTENEIMMII